MIECSLLKMSEFTGMESKRKRFGKYHGSSFWSIPGFGKSAWVVGTYIDLDFANLDPSLTTEQILDGCVEFLNTPPPRKKYQKKKPQPRYGFLSPYRGTITNRNGRQVLSALLITDNRKNKMFWSEGVNVPTKNKKN